MGWFLSSPLKESEIWLKYEKTRAELEKKRTNVLMKLADVRLLRAQYHLALAKKYQKETDSKKKNDLTDAYKDKARKLGDEISKYQGQVQQVSKAMKAAKKSFKQAKKAAKKAAKKPEEKKEKKTTGKGGKFGGGGASGGF